MVYGRFDSGCNVPRHPAIARPVILAAAGLIVVCMTSCGITSLVKPGTTIEYEEDRLLCMAMVQGSPLMVYVEIPREKKVDALVFRKVRWGYEAWLVQNDRAKCFYATRLRAKKDTRIIPSPDKHTIAAWTDKDQLVFGIGKYNQELLVVTDPIYADRNRRRGATSVEYTLVPTTLYFGKKVVSGSAFYQHRSFKGTVRDHGRSKAVASLTDGISCYLWDASGRIWYVEHLVGPNGDQGTFAVMQDQRGQW